MGEWEEIDNLRLIENDLIHLKFELGREEPSYFRIARGAHLVLYRSMVEALKGSANFAVTRRRGDKRAIKFKYEKGDKLQEITKNLIPGCKDAWRFSKPEPCGPPVVSDCSRQIEPEEYLIHFFETLAKIQTECFMGQFTCSKVVSVADDDMKTLEWLHVYIRNVYEHFVPRSYSAPKKHLNAAANLCLRLARELLLNSGNVSFHSIPEENLAHLFSEIDRISQREPG